MEAKELRIGNLINAPLYDEPIEVHSVCSAANDIFNRTTGEIPIDTISPIPLTEEWLLKLGFDKYQWCDDCAFIGFNNSHMVLRFFNGEWHCDKAKITKDNRGQKMSNGKPIIKNGFIKYVHQLQNLYFALTGKELTLAAHPTV